MRHFSFIILKASIAFSFSTQYTPRFIRNKVGVGATFGPMLRRTCLERLENWQHASHEDEQYSVGIEYVREWASCELSDVSYDEMNESEQRGVDSWAFPVQEEGEIQSIICAELVNQVGRDTLFFWPTVRLVHLVLRPSNDLSEAGRCILKAAEQASDFCVENRLRLDYATLRLTFNQLSMQPEMEKHDLNSALEWVDGGVNWDGLFEAVRGRDTYSEDDYVPGCT